MKTIKIAIIAIMGMNFGISAQQWDSNGDNSTTGNLTLDGNYINLNTPITTGGWARGFFNVGADKATRIGGVGLLGSKDVPRHYYMAHGKEPWSSGLGMYVKTNGNVGIGTTTPISKLNIAKLGQYAPGIGNGWGDFSLSDGNYGLAIGVANGGSGAGQVSIWTKGGNEKLLFGNPTNGTVMSLVNGNIGIGTTAPISKLNIAKLGQYASGIGNGWGDFSLSDGNYGLAIGVANGGSGAGQVSIWTKGGNEKLLFGNPTNGTIMSLVNGNVGIGTTNPKAKLNVNGHIKFDALGSGHTNIQIGHDTNDRIFADNSSNKSYGGGMFFRVTPDPSLNIVHNYIDVMMLTDKGKVGIGTKTMGTHKLAVEGSIGAREIKVEAYPNWSDFVFEKSYNLPTLKDVEEHIKEKGHLKDIPNAEEIKKNGFFLGEMDAKLLQKIEELTLYTIEQEKKLKIQEKKIDALEKKNSEIEELKSLVQKLLKDKN